MDMSILKKILIGFCCIMVTSNVSALPDQVLQAKDSVFNIITYLENDKGEILQASGTGTGFLINNNGEILTNHHVIDTQGLYDANLSALLQAVAKEAGCNTSNLSDSCKTKLIKAKAVLLKVINTFQPKIKVVDGNKIIESNLRDAEIKWKNKEQDIALIKVRGFQDKPSLVLSNIVPKQLEEVFAVGFPGVTSSSRLDQDTVQASITDGSVSLILPNGVSGISSRVIQHNADVNPGNSGGPLTDYCGRVVGINTQAVTTNGGRITQGVYFSSHIDSAIKALEDQNIEFNSTSDTCDPDNPPYYGIILSILGIMIALIAIIFSLKKPRQQIINTVETYTQYRRRGGKKHSSDTPVPLNESDGKWTLSGSIKNTGERINIEITEKELQQGRDITIGRNKNLCDYVIPDIAQLGRRHVRIIYRNGRLMAEDLGSANKTYLDNKELIPGKAVSLSSGSVLNLANIVYLTLS